MNYHGYLLVVQLLRVEAAFPELLSYFRLCPAGWSKPGMPEISGPSGQQVFLMVQNS